jgi:UDP-N-acetylmuramoyl-tripeptide--D-alanyl-D-alanine ligase
MRELGDVAEGEHEAVGRLAVQLGIERIVSVGPGTEAIDRGAAGAGAEAVHVADADAAVALLRSSARPGDVVLVKASRSVGLERVAGALLASSAPSPKADAS